AGEGGDRRLVSFWVHGIRVARVEGAVGEPAQVGIRVIAALTQTVQDLIADDAQLRFGERGVQGRLREQVPRLSPVVGYAAGREDGVVVLGLGGELDAARGGAGGVVVFRVFGGALRGHRADKPLDPRRGGSQVGAAAANVEPDRDHLVGGDRF